MRRLFPRLRPGADDGGMIIEVVVAAAVLLLIAGGILATLDAATASSGQQKMQAIGTDLAQSELERLRSRSFDELVGLDQSATVMVGGFRYTVTRQSTWAMESPPGASGCSTSSRSPEALRVSTTVRWPNMNRRPVVLDTLVAAPAGSRAHRGAYVAQITDRDGVGLQGLTVTLSGPTSVSGQTDVNGCVRFGDLPEDRYTLSFGSSGYMTAQGQTSISTEVDVVAGQTRSGSWEYDRAGRALVRFVKGNDTSVHVPVSAAMFDNASMSSLSTLSPASANVTSELLFPSTYSVWADNCVQARPASPTSVTVPRGATSSRVDVRLPVLSVRTSGNHPSTGTNELRVVTDCGTVFTGIGGSRVSTSGGRWTSDEQAFPYGTNFTVCIVNLNSGTYRWMRRTGVANTSNSGRLEDLGNWNPGSRQSTNPAQVCTF
jgi:hypothetical protein